MLILVLTLSALLQLCSSNPSILKLEAEEGVFTGDMVMRSAASGGKTVVVKDDQYVSLIFSMTSTCQVQVSNIRYSDGSGADICTVFIDGESIGQFLSTTEPSTSTHQWNKFYNSGTIGSTSLEMGQHLVKVTVSATDTFGVELDIIELSNHCGGFTTEETVTTEGDSNSNDSDVATGAGLGTAAAVLTLIAALIGCCTACCCWYVGVV